MDAADQTVRIIMDGVEKIFKAGTAIALGLARFLIFACKGAYGHSTQQSAKEIIATSREPIPLAFNSKDYSVFKKNAKARGIKFVSVKQGKDEYTVICRAEDARVFNQIIEQNHLIPLDYQQVEEACKEPINIDENAVTESQEVKYSQVENNPEVEVYVDDKKIEVEENSENIRQSRQIKKPEPVIVEGAKKDSPNEEFSFEDMMNFLDNQENDELPENLAEGANHLTEGFGNPSQARQEAVSDPVGQQSSLPKTNLTEEEEAMLRQDRADFNLPAARSEEKLHGIVSSNYEKEPTEKGYIEVHKEVKGSSKETIKAVKEQAKNTPKENSNVAEQIGNMLMSMMKSQGKDIGR